MKVCFATLAVLILCATAAQARQSDNGDGTFTNPPLYADYPDPDIIRVGDDFYFATTTFVNVPGLTILHSQDLVHWEIVSHVVSQLTGNPGYNITNGLAAYRNGVFAPSLRYYNGKFYVVVTPNGQNTRIYYASDIHGPWQYYQLSVGAFDPGLYIETNGVGYIFTSGGWDGHVTVHTLNANFSQVVATSNNVFYYSGIEGSKVVKRGDYYYCFNAHPGDLSLKISRATNIFGAWETIASINDGTGGHQGAIVDLADGSDFGFVMKDSGAIGRMTYISPIIWSNSWPIWGTSNAPGRVPATAAMPIQGRPEYQIPTSDDFSSSTLGVQWQWNHNPDNSRWSLTDRSGFLRLRPTAATNFWYARNTLTQKGQGPWSRGEVKLDLSNLQSGDVCGFGTLGKTNGQIAVTVDGSGNKTLNMRIIVDRGGGSGTNLWQTTVATAPFTGTNLYLRTELNFQTSKGFCSYSADGANWTALGGPFNLAFDWATGTFQGEQFAIFCYNPSPGTGYVDVDYFNFSDTHVHRYSFSETSGTTVADSLGGPAWNGTLPGGGTFSNGQLTLSSNAQQYVSLPAGIAAVLDDFTIETWVKLNSTANWNRIFDFGNNTTTYMFLTPQNGSTSRLRFAITTSGNGGEQQIDGAAALTAGVWHHVAVTLHGNTGVLYLNGVPVGTNSAMTLKPASLGSTANNYIGKSQWTDPYLNGVIDEFRIYDVALSSAEIAATFALGPNQLLSTNSPTLGLSLSGTILTLFWPLASAGFTLQSRTNLLEGSWVNVPSPVPQIVGSNWEVMLPLSLSNPSTFYRALK